MAGFAKFALVCVFVLQIANVNSLSLLQFQAKQLLSAEGGQVKVGSCTDTTGNASFFLGNEFIELGISHLGDFGSSCPKPKGFFTVPGQESVGMEGSIYGFGVQGPYIDYFLPGDPTEQFGLGYRLGSKTGDLMTGSNSLKKDKEGITVSSMTAGASSVSFTGSMHDKLELAMTYSIVAGERFFTTAVTVKNIATENLYDVRYHRSFDPDGHFKFKKSSSVNQQKAANLATANTVDSKVSDGDDLTIVSATSPENGGFHKKTGKRACILFATSDPRGVPYIGGTSNTAQVSYVNATVYDNPEETGYQHYGDDALQLTFGIGTFVPADDSYVLAPNTETTIRYQTAIDYIDSEADIVTTAAATEAAVENPVSASGDPHMINMHGETFDIYRTGIWEFLRLPREAHTSNADLRLMANVSNQGNESDTCTRALYITRFTLGGHWLNNQNIDVRVLDGHMSVSMGHHLLAPSPKPMFIGNSPHGYFRLDMPKKGLLTIRLGSASIAIGVDRQPVHSYLNLQATHLSGLSKSLGGLLGDDDHSWISMRPAACSEAYRLSQSGPVTRILSNIATAIVGSRVQSS